VTGRSLSSRRTVNPPRPCVSRDRERHERWRCDHVHLRRALTDQGHDPNPVRHTATHGCDIGELVRSPAAARYGMAMTAVSARHVVPRQRAVPEPIRGRHGDLVPRQIEEAYYALDVLAEAFGEVDREYAERCFVVGATAARGAAERDHAVRSANEWNELMRGWTSRVESDGRQVWELRKGEHVAALSVRRAPSGIELVLMVDGDLVRSRVFRGDQSGHLAAELATVIETTRNSFETKGWTQ
jgi:hypothetical protein